MAQKKSLIEEALYDAEQVRDTALANAKAQLEEAFEPRIKDMISKELQNEMEYEYPHVGEDPLDEPIQTEAEEEEDYDEEEGEVPGEQDTGPDEYEDEEEEEMDEGTGADGSLPDVTNADDATMDDEEMDEGRDLDLESVIAELEAEINEIEDYDPEHVWPEEDEDALAKDVENTHDGHKGSPDKITSEGEELDEEIIDLDELLQSIVEEDSLDEESMELDELFDSLEENEKKENLVEALKAENEKLTSDLAEHREAVEILRSKLNEVNLLNAKLLYTSKLFRKYNLNNSQKMKVVESFDRTKSVRETKLVYSTLAESFRMGGSSKSIKSKRNSSLTEGLASKPVKSTKPSKNKGEIIKEGNDVADRFRTLVNYNKNK